MPLSHRKRKLEESPESRERRLAARRQRRHDESPEARRRRLEVQKEAQRQHRSQELPEQRQRRLQAMAETARTSRSQEPPERRQQRLEAKANADRASRSQEPPERRQQRLEAMAEAARASRSQEPPERRQQRIEGQAQADRLRRHPEDAPAENATPPQLTDDAFISRIKQMYVDLKEGFQNTACHICMERFPSLKMRQIPNGEAQCERCHRSAQQPGPALFGDDNNMIPCAVPPELQDLTEVEELLVARVLAVTSMHRLPLGQVGYRGHVIFFPQNLTEVAAALPRTRLDIIVLKRPNQSTGTIQLLRVRRQRVLNALLWLKANNNYYGDIAIDAAAVQSLPEDGPFEGVTWREVDGDIEASAEEEEQGTQTTAESFVPNIHRRSESQNIQARTAEIFNWPTTDREPINEFATEGYLTMAFPTLFPNGEGDLSVPRVRTVTAAEYFKHLMQLEDGRFARHHRFRYVALNTVMRWRALETGRVYIRRHPDDAGLTVEDLRVMLQNGDRRLADRVFHYGTNLRGSVPYWSQQRSRLVEMVEQLGLPTLFITLSAADLQWPELSELLQVPEAADLRSRSAALNSNPALADWLFHHRVQLFLKAYYQDQLGATDYWVRVEYQHRGSPHIHGLVWLRNAPDVQALDIDIEEDKRRVEEFIDLHVSTDHPVGREEMWQVHQHPSVIPYADVQDRDRDLAELVSFCLTHRCRPGYCLKQKEGREECRFRFPKETALETRLERDESGALTLTTKRNDPLVNSFSPSQASAWRGNVDAQYCVDKKRVINYVAKYATKREPRSAGLRDTMADVIRHLPNTDGSLKVTQKLLTSTIGERDISAQETCHLLLQLPLYSSSREFVHVSTSDSRVLDRGDGGQVTTNKTALEKYCQRPPSPAFEQLSLFQYFSKYRVPARQGTPTERQKNAVVVCSPKMTRDINSEEFCCQQLLLHIPHREAADVLGQADSYREAFQTAVAAGRLSADPSLADLVREAQQNGPAESDAESEPDEEGGRQQDDYMVVCGAANAEQNEDLAAQIEPDHDWGEAAQRFLLVGDAATFIEQQKQTYLPGGPDNADVEPDLHLNDRQKEVMDMVHEHAHGDGTEPLRLLVLGTAGTGKSFLINQLKSKLANQVLVLGPTGVAAHNVSGHTLHSALSISPQGIFKELGGESLRDLQQKFAQVRYIIIDEISMVGARMLGKVDARLRQAKPAGGEQTLGGLSLIAVGDLGQIPPVADKPLYSTPSPRDLTAAQGRLAYLSITKCVVLDQVVRQEGDSIFRDLLMRLRSGRSTREDWELMKTRTPARAPDAALFQDATLLHPSVAEVNKANEERLTALGSPVAAINAVHTGPASAAQANPDQAGGLQRHLRLSEGARVMLTANIWTEQGLVNGAVGTIHSIVYQEGHQPPQLPAAVMVQFHGYTGPTLEHGCVPITPIQRRWSANGHLCSRQQLPLRLAWALTIHKCQGLTLDKAVIDLGPKEFAAGLSFVALSRARRLTDLLIKPMDFERLQRIGACVQMAARRAEEQRLSNLRD